MAGFGVELAVVTMQIVAVLQPCAMEAAAIPAEMVAVGWCDLRPVAIAGASENADLPLAQSMMVAVGLSRRYPGEIGRQQRSRERKNAFHEVSLK